MASSPQSLARFGRPASASCGGVLLARRWRLLALAGAVVARCPGDRDAAACAVRRGRRFAARRRRFTALGVRGRRGHGRRLDHLLPYLGQQFGILLEELARSLSPLAETGVAEADPGAAALERAALDAHVEQFSDLIDAPVEQDVELDLAERRRDLVLHHRHLGAVADRLLAVLELADAPDVEPNRGVELQRAPAGGRFRAAEHHSDLLADLVDEDQAGARA